MTGFVGRELELDRISGLLLRRARLVTLIGPGGIGKTCLAQEALRLLHRARRTPVHGVQLARLAEGADAAAIREAVAEVVLDPMSTAGVSAWDGVIEVLACREVAGRIAQSVLLLDNCEHVLPAVGEVVSELLGSIAGLTVVATSREPVGWVDEQLVEVGPLPADRSLELFRQRAELTGRSVTDPDHIDLATEICAHLHGHPLFIRLAAARMFYEPLPLILRQLTGGADDRRMTWQHGPRAGADSRHRTIGDVIDWSYMLCDEDERLLFGRLSVFAPGRYPQAGRATSANAGGADLEAILAICSDDVVLGTDDTGTAAAGIRLRRGEIRGLLDRLVEKSLVSVHIADASVRYSLVESLRLYAQQRLAERSGPAGDEPGRLAHRHRSYYRDVLVQARSRARTHPEYPGAAAIGDWARNSWEDIRLAIETSLVTPEQAVIGLQISTALIALQVSFTVSPLPTTRRWVETALRSARTSAAWTTDNHLRALSTLAYVTLSEGSGEVGGAMVRECLAGYGVEEAAERRLRRDPDSDSPLPAEVEFSWGADLFLRENSVDALVVLARATRSYRDGGDRFGAHLVRTFEALVAGFLAPPDEALAICRRYLAAATVYDSNGIPWAKIALSVALGRSGHAADALAAANEAVATATDHWCSLWAECSRMYALAFSVTDRLTARADTAADRRAAALATEVAQLAGGVVTLGARIGVDVGALTPLARRIDAATTVAREVLGKDAFAAAYERGQLRKPELAGVTAPARPPGGDSPARRLDPAQAQSSWSALTEAEQEVAVLAAAGWPNSAIGARRGTSTKTIDAQMSAIFQKLTIGARDEIRSFVPDDIRERVSAERARRPRRSRDHPGSGRSVRLAAS